MKINIIEFEDVNSGPMIAEIILMQSDLSYATRTPIDPVTKCVILEVTNAIDSS